MLRLISAFLVIMLLAGANVASADDSALTQQATTFVNFYWSQWSQDNTVALPFINSTVGDSITFYGTSTKHSDFMTSETQFATRWPARSYTIQPGSLIVSCDDQTSNCHISGIVNWNDSSVARNARSIGSENFDFQMTAQNANGAYQFLVTAQSGSIISRSISQLNSATSQSVTSSQPNATPTPIPPASQPTQTQAQSSPVSTPVTPTQPNSSVEAAWAPYTQYAACMLSKGFQLQTFVQDGVLPTDAIASPILNSCIQSVAQQTASVPPSNTPTPTPNNSNSTNSNSRPSSDQNASTPSSDQNPTSSQDNNDSQSQSTQTYTVTVQCGMNGRSDGTVACFEPANGDHNLSDGGSVLIRDANGNHNYGTLDMMQAGGHVQLSITSPFEVQAQAGGVGASFHLEVQIQNSSGKVVYDNDTVQAFQTIDVTDADLSNQNQASSQDNNNSQSPSNPTYTATIQCEVNGSAGTTGCFDAASDDGGSVLIRDASGNHNYGALDMIRAGGHVQLSITSPFEVQAQAGGVGEPFQLDVQIQKFFWKSGV